MLFICYYRCSTCKKAEKWLKDHKIKVDVRDIKTRNPSEEELALWQKKSGRAAEKFFNTSGQIYRQLGLKDKIGGMTDSEKFAFLATDGMLVKRPLLVTDDTVLVGFKEEEWAKALL